jgi:hypothetical protein
MMTERIIPHVSFQETYGGPPSTEEIKMNTARELRSTALFVRSTDQVHAGDYLVYNEDGTVSPLSMETNQDDVRIVSKAHLGSIKIPEHKTHAQEIAGIAVEDSQPRGPSNAPHRVPIKFEPRGYYIVSIKAVQELNKVYETVDKMLWKYGLKADNYGACMGHGEKFSEPQADPLCSNCRKLWNDASNQS